MAYWLFKMSNTPNTSKVDETTFTTTSSANKQETSPLRLRQKVKQDKLATLYRHLIGTGDLDLINLDQFKYAYLLTYLLTD